MWLKLLLTLAPAALLHAQVTSTAVVGWYNGDCQSTGVGGWANWYLSGQQFTRVYDSFTVPDGGWVVVGVFSNNQLFDAPAITQAAWELRSDVSSGYGGTLVAAGIGDAAVTFVPALRAYRIQVDGLSVALAPGQYWLSVTPVGPKFPQSYVCETVGGGASAGIGNEAAYYAPGFNALSGAGPGGANLHFSQGVLIARTPLTPAAAWQANIAYVVEQMPKVHSVPYPGITLADFNAKADALSRQIPSLSDAEIRTGFQALVSSINDPHTYVGWPSPNPFRYLPLTFYWYDEGIYITGAPAPYRNLLGGRLVSIGNVGVDEAVQRLTPLVAHDNDQWLKAMIPSNYFTNTDFLFGTGITDSTDAAQIQVAMPSGDVVTANVPAGSAGVRSDVYQGALPLYRQHPNWNYWAATVDNGATVYFQYNSCVEDPRQAFADFLAQLNDMLAQDGVQRLIVDMRNNNGGFAIIDPWIAQIAASRFNQPNRLFVIVGRATFSAAMQATDIFHDTTSATFVGEPTGAKPGFLIHVGDFTLPYFGMRVTYSNGLERTTLSGDALYPDIQTPVTFANYMNGADPALDAILSIPLPDK
jgi:hypothetical protein